MSASLVGSEMCIRDRAEGFNSATWSFGSPYIGIYGVGRARTSSSELCGCLLYTSDAADDM
eukprot:4693490-Alexandrium_andersonii.AAC.1